MIFFFQKRKSGQKTKKMQNSLLTKSHHRSPSSHQRTTLECGRARIKTDTHARTHAKERDLENSLRKCGRVLLLLSMMKPRRF